MAPSGMVNKATLAKVIAHRGASGSAPENTLAALRLAFEQGARCVEIDVSVSADDVPFVHHDDTLERCTDGNGAPSSHLADHLDTLNAAAAHTGFQREPLPRLSAVIDWIEQSGVGLNLEIKPEPGLETRTAEAVARMIDTRWPATVNLVFSSFSTEALAHVQARLPDIPRALLIPRARADVLDSLQALGCRNLHLSVKATEDTPLEDIKQLGYGLYVYTVNDVDLAKSLYARGVDGVFTDFPGRLIEGLGV